MIAWNRAPFRTFACALSMNNRHDPMTQQSLLRRLLLASLVGCALAFTAVATPIVLGALTPAQAQVSAEFRAALDPYGAWVRHPRWGEVWVPDDVPPDWRPYTYGHWIYTDDWGWYWISDEQEEDWGWITYHYGRWGHDRRLGWFWIPGNEWGPAWVDWRRGDDYVGWAPLPPDDTYYEYDDEPTYWVFLRPRYMLALRLHRYFVPPARTTIIIRNTVVINRTIVVEHQRNGRARIAVNAGISPAIVAAARRSAVPTFRVNPTVLPGTRNVAGAAVVRPQDLKRSRPGQRQLAPRVAQTSTTVQPATSVPKPRPLGKNERGRLGSHPPRAAQGAILVPNPAPPAATPQQQQKVAPSPTAPRTAPPPAPRVTAPPVKPTPRVVPPPQAKPESKPQPRVEPKRPPVTHPPAARPAPPPNARPAPPQAVRPAPPPQIKVQRPPPPHAPPPPRVQPLHVQPPKPPAHPVAPHPVQPPQAHRPPPAQKPAAPPAHKPPPKPGEKEQDNKR